MQGETWRLPVQRQGPSYRPGHHGAHHQLEHVAKSQRYEGGREQIERLEIDVGGLESKLVAGED